MKVEVLRSIPGAVIGDQAKIDKNTGAFKIGWKNYTPLEIQAMISQGWVKEVPENVTLAEKFSKFSTSHSEGFWKDLEKEAITDRLERFDNKIEELKSNFSQKMHSLDQLAIIKSLRKAISEP